MPDTFQSILIGAVAGIVSSVLTYFSTKAKLRLELSAEYDKKLQEKRLEVYLTLWEMLEPIARYGRERPITYQDIIALSNKTRIWYFKVGGIYLTESSRTPYFNWKKIMQKIIDNETLLDSLIDDVINSASNLRTSLSNDIGTKKLSWFD
jgi:hypothetical protein